MRFAITCERACTYTSLSRVRCAVQPFDSAFQCRVLNVFFLRLKSVAQTRSGRRRRPLVDQVFVKVSIISYHVTVLFIVIWYSLLFNTGPKSSTIYTYASFTVNAFHWCIFVRSFFLQMTIIPASCNLNPVYYSMSCSAICVDNAHLKYYLSYLLWFM